MEQLSVNKFRANIKQFVDKAIHIHEPIRVTRRGGEDFIVIGVDDFEREIETINVLQNKSLMKQISESMKTHSKRAGYHLPKEDENELVGI